MRIFWIVMVPLLAVISVMLSDAPRPDFLITEPLDPWTSFVVLFLTGICMAGALRGLVLGGRDTLRNIAAWVGICTIATLSWQNREDITRGATYVYDRSVQFVHSKAFPSYAVSVGPDEIEIYRDWDNHFRARVEVNGVETRMLIDTGASVVLVPYEDAARFGIDVKNLDFSLPVNTANGRSSVAPVRLSSILIGEVEVFEVEAAVAQPGQLATGLLGMTFLRHFDETSFRGDTLYLRRLTF